ncbi:MAG: nickel insertion protein [Gammaproteobacteria bacterium]|nr:nickel insertion protein [Gammaproteobacteria bacterium]
MTHGIAGERVTPTGAAILKYLAPSRRTPPGARLSRTGFGFGSKRMTGISNVVRLLAFDTATDAGWDQDQVLELEFEIDDQTAEELAWAVDRLRREPGVRDIVQTSVLGERGAR